MVKPAQNLKPRLKLNLLHPQGATQKLPARFLKWLISYGRFIVIGVEAVVIGAFVMRFSLDAKLDDLKKKINDDVPYVISLSLDEALIRQTQFRLSIIKKSFDQAGDWTNILNNLTAKLPIRITFVSLNLERPANSPNLQFRLNAKTDSNIFLGQYLDSLKKDPHFKDIALANIIYDQGQIIFTIAGQTK